MSEAKSAQLFQKIIKTSPLLNFDTSRHFHFFCDFLETSEIVQAVTSEEINQLIFLLFVRIFDLSKFAGKRFPHLEFSTDRAPLLIELFGESVEKSFCEN